MDDAQANEATQVEQLLRRMAFERTQFVLPALLIAVAIACVVTPFLGAPIPPWVWGVNAVLIAGGIAIYVALRRKRIPQRYAHAITAAVWAIAPISTIAGQAGSGQAWLLMTFTIEMMAAALQLSLRWAIASTSVILVLYVPLAVRDAGALTALFISGVTGAAVAGCVICMFMRRTITKAEQMRLQEQRATVELRATATQLQTTADALARELDERRRAEREGERLREQFIDAQRLEAVGTLAAGMAHDMNNILAGILGVAEDMRDAIKDDALRADCATIVSEAERGAALTRSLLAFSRRGQYRRQPILLDEVVDQVEPLLARTLPRGITITRTGRPGVMVDVDSPQLTQAIINLCINGADAMDGNGTLSIHTDEVVLGEDDAERLQSPDRRWARVTIADTGRGMDDATRMRIFEPFFTTKSIGKGTGLGLAMVYGAIQGHGGAIEVSTAPGRGSSFRVLLPIIEPPEARAEPEVRVAPDPKPARSRGTALIVDDEAVIRLMATRMLERLGFDVLTAQNGADALEVFDRHNGEFTIVLLDMAMPVMDGPECFRQLRERGNVPVVLVSGFALDHEAQAVLSASAAGFLDKPFSRSQLVAEIERLLPPPSVRTAPVDQPSTGS